MKTSLSSILVLWLAANIFADPTNVFVHPDSVVQKAIDNTTKQLAKTKSQQEADQAIRALRQQASNGTHFVEQFLYYLRYGITTEAQGYGAIGLWSKIDVDRMTKVKAIMPFLDISDNELSKLAVDLLRSTDKDKTSVERVNFGTYEEIIKATPTNPPFVLIRYMYERNPQAALRSMSRMYGAGEEEAELTSALAELSPKLTAKAKEALQALAKRPEWWVQLYVATKIDSPVLMDSEILKQLEKYKHPLVREKLAEIRSKQDEGAATIKQSSDESPKEK